jgi:hypothetical protein
MFAVSSNAYRAMGNDLPYKRQAGAEFDKRASETMKVKLLPDEKHAVVARMHGPCPACSHETAFDYPLVAVEDLGVQTDRDGESLVAAAEALGRSLVDLAEAMGRSSGSEDIRGHCLCHEVHAGQPKDEPGCGVRWGVHVSWGGS